MECTVLISQFRESPARPDKASEARAREDHIGNAKVYAESARHCKQVFRRSSYVAYIG